MNENQTGKQLASIESPTQPLPPLSASCRARHITNSDQVECLSLQSKGCKFVLSIGKARICLHPERHEIAAR